MHRLLAMLLVLLAIPAGAQFTPPPDNHTAATSLLLLPRIGRFIDPVPKWEELVQRLEKTALRPGTFAVRPAANAMNPMGLEELRVRGGHLPAPHAVSTARDYLGARGAIFAGNWREADITNAQQRDDAPLAQHRLSVDAANRGNRVLRYPIAYSAANLRADGGGQLDARSVATLAAATGGEHLSIGLRNFVNPKRRLFERTAIAMRGQELGEGHAVILIPWGQI